MFKTHLAFGALLGLAFLPHVNNKWIFIPIVLFCSLLPDIDSMHSYLGKNLIFRPLQWFVKHRDFLHSFTFAIIIALIFAFYFPIIALPFFLGYSGHLFMDAITKEGIRPFWPLKEKIEWRIKTGGRTEEVLFYSFLLIGLILLVRFAFLYA